MGTVRRNVQPVILSDLQEETVVAPVSSAPNSGVVGLPVYVVQGAGVQPTEDSADGTPGSAPPAVAMQVAGSDGSFLRALSTDSSGKLNVNATFSGSISGNAAAGPTGSAVPSSADYIGGNLAGNLKGINATSAGALVVDGSASTQPISGTVTANAGTGTFAISAAALPLPSGAATLAKQPALGTAGTASADVITIQGIASMTAVKVDGSGVTQPVSGTVAVSNFPATQPVSGTIAATQSGTWTVQPGNTANTTAWKVDGSAVTQPVSGTITAVTSISNAVTVVGAAASGAAKSGNPVQVGGVFNTTQPTVTTGQAVEMQATARGAQIVATGVDAFAVNATLSAETTKVIGTVNISASQTVGLVAGSAVIGHVIVDTAPSTAVTNAGTFAVQQTPKTSGGLGLPFSASVNATKQQVKGTAGNVYGWNIVNNTAAIAYCQVFNLASASVTVGSTTPDYVIAIPGNSTTGAGNSVALDLGISHSTGITIACTTTRTGSTNAACDVLFFYN